MFRPSVLCVASSWQNFARHCRGVTHGHILSSSARGATLLSHFCPDTLVAMSWGRSGEQGHPSMELGQIRFKVKSSRINRKAAGKAQATTIYEQRVMKQMADRIQRKLAYVDSPPFIIGFHDRLHQDRPWDLWSHLVWLLSKKQRRLDTIEEAVRAQAVTDELANTHNQTTTCIKEHGQNLYISIKQQLARGAVPQSLVTRECGEAIGNEFATLAKDRSRLVDWRIKPGCKARILQYRTLPNPQTQQTFFQDDTPVLELQVFLQLQTEEIQTVQTATGLKEIELSYDPLWVLAKCADTSPQAERSTPSSVFGGWKLCARLNDHEIGSKRVGTRREAASMVPDGAMHVQLQRVWQAAKFCIANDQVTWPSWFLRWALEIKRL